MTERDLERLNEALNVAAEFVKSGMAARERHKTDLLRERFEISFGYEYPFRPPVRTKEFAAVKRESMKLSRALARLREGNKS